MRGVFFSWMIDIAFSWMIDIAVPIIMLLYLFHVI